LRQLEDLTSTLKKEIKEKFNLRSTPEILHYTKPLYPDLSALHNKVIETNHRFHQKVFEAVLAAHIYGQRQKDRAYQ